MQDTNSKPSKRFVAHAVATRKGFKARFSIPGHYPAYVQEYGEVKVFKEKEAADLAAHQLALYMANERLGLRTRFQPAMSMTAEELSKALDDFDISPTYTAKLLQTEHVMGWLNGDRRIPHMARIILELMRDPAIRNKVASITEAAIKEGQNE